MSAALYSSACAVVLLVKREYAPPVSSMPTSRSTTRAIGCRRRAASAFTGSPFLVCIVRSRERWSLHCVDDEEQRDPHDVHEVPVVRDAGGERRLAVAEALGAVGATDHEQERDEAAEHVQSVEAGRHVEDGAVSVGVDRDAVRDERGVLHDLAGHEHRAEDEGEEEPLDHAPGLDVEEAPGAVRLEVVLSLPDTDLAGERRRHEDEGV